MWTKEVKGYKIKVCDGVNALTYKNQVNITESDERSAMFLFDSMWLAEDFQKFAIEIINETENFNLRKFTKDMDGEYFYTPKMYIPRGKCSQPKQVMGADGPYWK